VTNNDGTFTAEIPLVIGANIVTVTVTDAAGNTTTQTITITRTDDEAPVITRLGEPSVTIIQGTIYADAGATALDNVDGDITNNIVTTSDVNNAVV